MKAGKTIIITLTLQKPRTGEVISPLNIECNGEEEIFAKVDELARTIKSEMNLTADQIATDVDKEAGRITTSSPEALKYYVEGRKYRAIFEDEKAMASMQRAVEIDPEFAMAYRAMAILSGGAERRKYLKKALELSARLPENERLLIQGQSFYDDEDFAKAIDALERLVKIYPDYSVGYIMLANAYAFGAGDTDKAIQYLELAVQIDRSGTAVGNLADFYTGKGLYKKAEDVCRSFLQEVEYNLWVQFGLMSSYICQRKFDLALAAAEKGCLLNPDYYQQFIGQILLYKGDFSGAQKALQEVCEKKRMGSKNVLWCLALIRGHYKEGLTLLQKNLEGSKGNTADEADANRSLALGLEKGGRYEEAYKALDQSLKLSAEDRKSAGEFGVPYLPSEQVSDLFTRGRIQAEMKLLDQAQRTAGELGVLIDHGINKEDRQAQEYLLGQIEFEKKNYQKAADLFGKACSRINFEGGYWGEIGEGAHAPWLDRLARAFYESGNLDKARTTYEKITLLTTGRFDHGDIYAKAFYMLGKIAEQQGDRSRARDNYRKFLDLWKDADPGLPEIPDAMKRLAAL